MENLEFVDLFQENKIHKIFNNLSQNQKVIKADSIKAEPFKEMEHQHQEDVAPEIKLHKKDDVVELITVTCGCGRETQIVLQYDTDKNNNKITDSIDE